MQSFKYCTGTYLYLDRVGILIRRSPFCGCLCARQRGEAWTFIGWLLIASHHSMSVCLLLYQTHLHIGYDHWVAIIDERYIDPRYGKLPLVSPLSLTLFLLCLYPLALDFWKLFVNTLCIFYRPQKCSIVCNPAGTNKASAA